MTSDKTTQLHHPFQEALFKAAKVGNVKLMRELIKAGANPFASDKEERNAISYALASNLAETVKLLETLFPVVPEIGNDDT